MQADLPPLAAAPRADPWAAGPAQHGLTRTLAPLAGALVLRSTRHAADADAFERLFRHACGYPCPARVGAIAELPGSVLALRMRPHELLVLALGQDGALLAGLKQAAQSVTGALLSATAIQDGLAAVCLRGAHARALLRRLVDDDSLPQQPGRASTLRCVDIAATLVWRQPDDYLLLVDVGYLDYLAQWIDHAASAVAASDLDCGS